MTARSSNILRLFPSHQTTQNDQMFYYVSSNNVTVNLVDASPLTALVCNLIDEPYNKHNYSHIFLQMIINSTSGETHKTGMKLNELIKSE